MRHAFLFALVILCAVLPSPRLFAGSNFITLPAQVRHNRVYLQATIHHSEPLLFLLDSGSALTTLHPDVATQLQLKPSGRVRIIGISGEERAPTYKGVPLFFGPVTYKPQRIASLPSERETSRRRRDGVLGSGMFREYVVEIDAPAKQVRLHSPSSFRYSGTGEIIPIRFEADTPIVSGSLQLRPELHVEGDFEIDTGCDSGVCIGQGFVVKHQLLDHASVVPSEKFGVGGSVETQSGTLPALKLAGFEAREPQIDFFMDGSPVDEPLAGHIGMGVLVKHKVIFDYSRKRLIVEPGKNQDTE